MIRGAGVVFVTLVCVAVVHGGVGVLSQAEEEDVLALYAKICSARIEGPEPGDPSVYCKESPDTIVEEVRHHVTLTGSSVGEKQVVFIRPPPITYQHNVQIQGSTGAGPKTKIYVLPQKSQHEISSQYAEGEVVTQKPTVYFLKSEIS